MNNVIDKIKSEFALWYDSFTIEVCSKSPENA